MKSGGVEKLICVVLLSMAVFAYGEDAKTTPPSVNIGVDEFKPFTYQDGKGFGDRPSAAPPVGGPQGLII